MTLAAAILIGALYAGAFYMLMRRSLFKLVIGLALLSHAANLLLFVSDGLKRAKPPVLPASGAVESAAYTDPVPQALILTAIVIGFAVLAFALALFNRAYEESGLVNVDELGSRE